MATWVSETKTCSIPDCGNPLRANGYCTLHYQRARKGKDLTAPAATERLSKDEHPECVHPGCTNLRTKYGRLCRLHYMRKRKGADMDAALRRGPKWRVNTHGYVDKTTYVDGKRVKVLQHRVVMAEMLGRDLLPHENVHHINGQRADNRPENLELWSTSQPSGQKVEDKMKWAKAFLEDYGVRVGELGGLIK